MGIMDKEKELKKAFEDKLKFCNKFDAFVLILHNDNWSTYKIARVVGKSDMYIVRSLARAKKKQTEYEKNK